MKSTRNKFAHHVAIDILFAALLACSNSPLSLLMGTLTPLPSPTPLPLPSPTPAPTAAPLTPVEIKVVSSLPLTGYSSEQARVIVYAEQLRLAQANNSACGGKYKITYESLDDSSISQGEWDASVETQNATAAAADDRVIAYLGTFDSGAAKLSIPILNQAGMLMISPANTYPGLTKKIPGGSGEPDVYYPTGVRNYARVVSSDDVQGAVAARYMKNVLRIATVYIIDDNELYGLSLAEAFEKTAGDIGLTVLGHKSIDPTATNYRALMAAIANSNHGKPPDAIYAGMLVDNHADQVLKDKVRAMGGNTRVKFVGPDGIQTQYFIKIAGAGFAEGVYASVAGLPFEDLNPAGQQFLQDYRGTYGDLTEPYAVYGYEAMNVLLQAIENVCSAGGDAADRETVRAAVFAIKDFQGVLGTWSFDENGDTTLTDLTFYQVQNGRYVDIGVYK